MNWQPIKTAPKDGTLILAYGKNEMAVVSWDIVFGGYTFVKKGWCVKFSDILSENTQPYTLKPTHWMPLPKPPVTK